LAPATAERFRGPAPLAGPADAVGGAVAQAGGEPLAAAAEPGTGGKVERAKLEARHDAQVKAALASGGPCSLLVLGGGHDLSASVRRLGGGAAEYVRITTRRYREFAGQDLP
jgi:hypothetical protein